MDELDRLILETLQRDGRTPFTHIARQAGVSETTVRTRYSQLVEEGIVRVVGLVDPAALGFRAPAVVGVSVEPGRTAAVARAIRGLKEVSYLVATLGSFDLIVELFCRDLPHLTETVTRQIHAIPGVRDTETLVIAESYKLSCYWSPYVEGQGLPGQAPQEIRAEQKGREEGW
jgi:Lrp/AsnC family transcriptional regulator for asnA, asnC and gidA